MKDDKIFTAVSSCMGLLVMLPLLALVHYFFNGWALSLLWIWFMVPVFHVPPLSIAQAVGVAMLVGYLTYQAPPEIPGQRKKKIWETFLESLFTGIFGPAVAVLFGWLVHLFL